MELYKSKRIIDRKARWIIVDENGKIINRNPSKDDLKDIEYEKYKRNDKNRSYADKELLNELRRAENEYGRPPTVADFTNNPEYPNFATYSNRFGSWSKALKLVGLDVESMIKKGFLENSDQKARFTEMIVRDHFKNHPIDLAGENKNNPCDGLCPNNNVYDVKSSKFYGRYWYFHIHSKYKEEIEIFYLLAFNSDWTKLEYAWRVPGEMVEKDHFYVGTTYQSEFNIENMKEYDITEQLKLSTDKFKNIFKELF